MHDCLIGLDRSRQAAQGAPADVSAARAQRHAPRHRGHVLLRQAQVGAAGARLLAVGRRDYRSRHRPGLEAERRGSKIQQVLRVAHRSLQGLRRTTVEGVAERKPPGKSGAETLGWPGPKRLAGRGRNAWLVGAETLGWSGPKRLAGWPARPDRHKSTNPRP